MTHYVKRMELVIYEETRLIKILNDFRMNSAALFHLMRKNTENGLGRVAELFQNLNGGEGGIRTLGTFRHT